MKRLFLGIFTILTLTFAGLATPVHASTNDFSFSSGIFNYYLDRTEDGYSKMHVEEELSAIFPNFNQNHGIERCIPRKYRGVQTLPNPNFAVTRNGLKEPFSTYSEGENLCLRIGDADSYVHGSQTYLISYDLYNVILAPSDSKNQELYWDANGTGWYQSFDTINATVHLSDEVAGLLVSTDADDASCYVGAYGTSGSLATSRCTVMAGESGSSGYSTAFLFVATDVEPRETLTFDLAFKPDSFTIKGPGPNYVLIVIIALDAIIAVILIIKWRQAEAKIKDKRTIARDKAVPVQYVPPKGLTVAESGTIWLKSASGSLQVATLMELAVHHNIALERGEKKRFGGYHWTVHLKDVENLSAEQKITLEILNGGSSVHNGDSIEIKRHSATSHLEKLGREFPEKIEGNLRGKQLFESNTRVRSSKFVVILIIGFIILFTFASSIISLIFNAMAEADESGASVLVLIASVFTFLIISIPVAVNISKYKKRTLAGVKTSKYLDGLKEYMNLAEKDRLNFLQSVKGADTTHEGIVKLYEKLLPYAVLFGIENSWLSELNKYYEMDDVTDNTWLLGAAYLSTSDFRSFSSYTSSSISSSTASESSGSSGGGGGGFSGGGGGGGGGGGW